MQSLQEKMAIVDAWESSNLFPRNPLLLSTENNHNVLAASIANVDIPDIQSVARIVAGLTQKGLLQYDALRAVQPATQPADGLPHANEPVLAAFTTVESFNDKALVAKFMRDAANVSRGIKSLYDEINAKFVERQRFVKERGIHARQTESPAQRPDRVRAAIAVYGPSSDQAAAAALQDLDDKAATVETEQAIGKLRVGGYSKTESIRDILRNEVATLTKRGVTPREIQKYITRKIKSYEPDDSIR